MSSVQRVPSRVTSDKGNTQVPEAQTQPAMADLGRHGSIPRQPAHSPPPNFSGSDDGSMSEAGSDADLPQVTVDMIPLSVIVGRMVTYAYTELVTLIETLPSRTEENRRSEIQKYTQHMREQLTKLLVLVKWSRNAPQIQKCQNAIAYLQSQNEYFTRAVDGLYATYLALPQARLRNYDVATAVDVLTTGTYRRLPGVVKEAFVPPPKLTRAQVSKTLEAINGIIRARILRGEPVPTAMRRYSIDGGKVSFVVAGEFEATLTLLQYSNVPWHVVAIKMLVGSDPALKGEMAIRLDKRQTTDMAQHCQAQLLQESAVPQLARLYDFLHMQSLSILLDTVAKQAAVLRRVRWENLLQIETGADKSLVLRYWTSSRAAAAATTTAASGNSATGGRGNAVVIRLCPLPIPRPIHASAIEGPDALEASPDDADDKHEFLRIEQDRRNLIPKLGLSITWTAQSGLRNTHTWARTVAQASELSEDVADGSDGGVVLDSEGINVERLLRQVTWRHSVKMLESLYSSVVESGLFDEGAVELLYATASGEAKHSVGAAEAAQAAVVPKLRAWYRQGEGAVDITVDAFMGRLVVRASEVVSASASLSEAMIGHLADQANRAPWRLAELLVDMRSSLALADLDSMAFRSLGLRPMGTAGSGLLPGFVLTSVRRRVEASVPAAVASAQTYLMGSPATAAAGVGGSVPAAANFPLRISQQEADALMRGIGTEQPLSRVRFYKIEGCDGEWYLMAAMTDRLHFRLVLLTPHAKDQLLYDVGQVIALQVDRLFSSVARRLLAEKELDPSMLRGYSSHSKRLREAEAEWDVTERVDAMLSGRTSITLDYLNALASTCRARLALRLLQTQLTEWKIPYSFRIPSFSTSPHGHRAAVSKELSVVGLDKQGLYELDEQVPVLYLPIAALMRASPINWHVASSGVLADEARRMVSIRIASDELDPALRSDGMRPVEYRPLGSRTAGVQTLVGRHVIPCQVVASIPVALDGLPATVAAAHADAVYFGAHASPDGGYHGRGAGGSKGGYSKMVLVYRNAGRALQSLIRDWSEHHLMTHVARQLCMWEQRSLRRMLAATTAFYPFSAGPHTSALARMLGAGEHTATELVLQCVDSYLLSISCRVPEPFAPADVKSELSYHLTMAQVEPESNRILCIGSTWPWAHGERPSSRRMGFEVSANLSRWLRTLQARMNLTGNPLSVLSLIIQLAPLNEIISIAVPTVNIRSLSPSLGLDSMIPAGFAQMLGETEPEDKSHLVVDRLTAMKEHVRSSMEDVSGLNIMPMHTAADNIRLVFNTRFVVDVRLVAYDTFHISDVVASARVFAGSQIAAGSSASAPAPLVTTAMEPIPRFAQWLEALSTKMTLDWPYLEDAVTALFKEVATDDLGFGPTTDKTQRILNLQRNIHRLRPGATKVEAFMFKFRELHMRQNSARAPPFVPLPPTALICTNIQLLVTLRSLMMWLKMSVNVVDAIEAAVSKYVGTGHLAVDELLVDHQQVLVAYTGCRGTVRCEYKLNLDSPSTDDSELLGPSSKDAAGSVGATAPTATATEEKPFKSLAFLVNLFTVPKNLLRASWDVRILPIVRPPKGVSERVAAYLTEIVERLGAEKTASTLVQLLALPAHVLEDTVHIAMELSGKVSVTSLETGHHFAIRLNTSETSVMLALTFALPDRTLTVVMSYLLLTGTAEVLRVIADLKSPNTVDPALDEQWKGYVRKVIKKLDDRTAFTLDMGKDGKSRWLDIVKELHAEACAAHKSST